MCWRSCYVTRRQKVTASLMHHRRLQLYKSHTPRAILPSLIAVVKRRVGVVASLLHPRLCLVG